MRIQGIPAVHDREDVKVQLHSALAGLALTRATEDVDVVLEVGAGAVTFFDARAALEGIGYQLQLPLARDSLVHRFVRDSQKVDVMVEDRLSSARHPSVGGHKVFAVPAGASALRKTMMVHFDLGDGSVPVVLRVPDQLGALVLKGAAYKGDSRDRDRHLDDAVLLACALTDPLADATRMVGSDRRRVRVPSDALADPTHRAWLLVPERLRRTGFDRLKVLSADPAVIVPRRGLGRGGTV